MISILIPIYNYNAFPLVKELHDQCIRCYHDFEIICIDDYSSHFENENKFISELEKCSFLALNKNIGRSKIRNLLAARATYQWLLFLDCDTFPKNKLFITSYLKQVQNSSYLPTFGGLDYLKEKPKDDQLLRWVYGKKREEKTIDHRQRYPYQSSFLSNFLIRKSLFESLQFDETITTYGYEDRFFIDGLKNKNILIDQIDNPVYHLNLETSKIFLSKTKEALQTLLSLKQIQTSTKLLSTFYILQKLKLVTITGTLYNCIARLLEKNLLSKKPSMILFDLYKIGYFCSLNKK